jgi:ammonium transporter, Amt family
MIKRVSILSMLMLVLSAGRALAEDGEAALSAADTSWMLMSTAMVLLMTPALAFFYGGLVRSKNALNTMMMCFAGIGVSGILWVVLGYSLAFGGEGRFVGDFSMALLNGVGLEPEGTIPHLLFMAFQGTFFIITAALISGAVVERMRFGPYLVFVALWGLLVYAPVCYWVWGGGWLDGIGALDFAGGAVVHVNAAAAAVVAALVLGPRKDYGRQALLPHQVPFVLLGAGLLWFGWFGFNGGSALAADGLAALAFVNTLLAPAATMLAWTLLDFRRSRRATAVGAATSIVVGLVAITPAAGFVSPIGAISIGFIAAVPSYFLILWRTRTRLDDSLDVFAAHGVGGMAGAILTGVFADAAWNGEINGALFGNFEQVGIQALSIVAVLAYSGLLTFGILKLIGAFTSLRVGSSEEAMGLDIVNHGEEAYADGEGAILLLDEEMTVAPRPQAVPSRAVPVTQLA